MLLWKMSVLSEARDPALNLGFGTMIPRLSTVNPQLLVLDPSFLLAGARLGSLTHTSGLTRTMKTTDLQNDRTLKT